MEENQSSTHGFILRGISGQQKQDEVFSILFLFLYLITVIGNLLIILAIYSDIRLHTPMYFLLANLSIVDIFSPSVTIPKTLSNYIMHSKAISFEGCLAQMYFMVAFLTVDSYILAAMAYDRAVAISRPLHYTTIMSPRTCVLLVVGSWLAGNGDALIHTVLAARLTFCGNLEVDSFYCDVIPLLKLACSDTQLNQKMVHLGVSIFAVPLLCIIFSYVRVFATVLRVPSTKGVRKAFSTCGSHLTVVSLYYGSVMGVNFRPMSSHTINDIVGNVMYMVVTPMLNPFIYSLRNRDMKAALAKLFSKRVSLQPI